MYRNVYGQKAFNLIAMTCTHTTQRSQVLLVSYISSLSSLVSVKGGRKYVAYGYTLVAHA